MLSTIMASVQGALGDHSNMVLNVNTQGTIPVPFEAFQELETYFRSVEPPYTLRNIRKFNAIYGRIYPTLTRGEKLQAESFVDEMIEKVEHKQWITRIYGVV